MHFEDLLTQIEDEERMLFLNFIKRMLCWRPEDRSSAGELLSDPWFNGIVFD